jgi:hypothetical protein
MSLRFHGLLVLEINLGLGGLPRFDCFFFNSCFSHFYPLAFVQLKIELCYFYLFIFL